MNYLYRVFFVVLWLKPLNCFAGPGEEFKTDYLQRVVALGKINNKIQALNDQELQTHAGENLKNINVPKIKQLFKVAAEGLKSCFDKTPWKDFTDEKAISGHTFGMHIRSFFIIQALEQEKVKIATTSLLKQDLTEALQAFSIFEDYFKDPEAYLSSFLLMEANSKSQNYEGLTTYSVKLNWKDVFFFQKRMAVNSINTLNKINVSQLELPPVYQVTVEILLKAAQDKHAEMTKGFNDTKLKTLVFRQSSEDLTGSTNFQFPQILLENNEVLKKMESLPFTLLDLHLENSSLKNLENMKKIESAQDAISQMHEPNSPYIIKTEIVGENKKDTYGLAPQVVEKNKKILQAMLEGNLGNTNKEIKAQPQPVQPQKRKNQKKKKQKTNTTSLTNSLKGQGNEPLAQKQISIETPVVDLVETQFSKKEEPLPFPSPSESPQIPLIEETAIEAPTKLIQRTSVPQLVKETLKEKPTKVVMQSITPDDEEIKRKEPSNEVARDPVEITKGWLQEIINTTNKNDKFLAVYHKACSQYSALCKHPNLIEQIQQATQNLALVLQKLKQDSFKEGGETRIVPLHLDSSFRYFIDTPTKFLKDLRMGFVTNLFTALEINVDKTRNGSRVHFGYNEHQTSIHVHDKNNGIIDSGAIASLRKFLLDMNWTLKQ